MNQKKNFPGANQWDSTNSTYKHRIFLTNNKELVGYSKGKYVSEPHDKTVLLERVITRLTNGGYLNVGRVHRIEFYFNQFLGGNDDLILVLYPDRYSLGKNETIVSDQRLLGFLTLFYQQLNSGKSALKNIVHKPKLSSEEELFDTRRPRFRNEAALHKFVVTTMSTGNYETARVMAFMEKYKENHPFTSSNSAK